MEQAKVLALVRSHCARNCCRCRHDPFTPNSHVEPRMAESRIRWECNTWNAILWRRFCLQVSWVIKNDSPLWLRRMVSRRHCHMSGHRSLTLQKSRHWIHLEFAGQYTVVPGPVDYIRQYVQPNLNYPNDTLTLSLCNSLVRNWNRHQFSWDGFPHRRTCYTLACCRQVLTLTVHSSSGSWNWYWNFLFKLHMKACSSVSYRCLNLFGLLRPSFFLRPSYLSLFRPSSSAAT